MTCTGCGADLAAGAAFCEACGRAVERADGAAEAPTSGTAAGAAAGESSPFSSDDLGSGPISMPTHVNAVPGSAAAGAGSGASSRPCLACGGEVDGDGYCTECGTKQAAERDHFRETPASWVAGVCDRGLVHAKNEDAMALLATEPPNARAVLVVLDGVSSSLDSDVASLAGARAARDSLLTPLPRGMGTEQGRTAAVTSTLGGTVQAANDAIVATTDPDSPSPASATFAVAVVEGTRLTVANVGDSRVYWVPDEGETLQLTVDDSAAQQLMEAGMERQAAENGPHGHAITRWLGSDAPDLSPRVAELDLAALGWVLACSDGLWNYASEPEALGEQVALAVRAGADRPEALALALVAYANACGGRDNITVAVARIGPPPDPSGHNAAPETVPATEVPNDPATDPPTDLPTDPHTTPS